MTILTDIMVSPRLSGLKDGGEVKIQIPRRRRSTGPCDRTCWVKLIQQNNEEKLTTESDGEQIRKDGYKNYVGDGKEKVTTSDTNEVECAEYESNLFNSTSDSSLSLSESDSDENDFHPELFGLLDNPGVVRFGCVDYPLAVTEYSDDEYLAVSEHNTAPDWIRVSYDDLNLDIDTAQDYIEDIDSDSKMLSRSLDDIHISYNDVNIR
eukprot:GFUD01139173.1.p1 GENE.GFUD01139173.1~~GFUD01139173.1.p1  ORF type:complete len:208 (+),score=59.51 GFUD01139173.1:164-787(+)